jgi:hypothetical protein
MKKLVWSFVAVALGVTALNIVSAQSPGVGLTALPSVTPLGPELIFAWQTGTGGSGATACSCRTISSRRGTCACCSTAGRER